MIHRSFVQPPRLRNLMLATLTLFALSGTPAIARAADPVASAAQRAVAWLAGTPA